MLCYVMLCCVMSCLSVCLSFFLFLSFSFLSLEIHAHEYGLPSDFLQVSVLSTTSSLALFLIFPTFWSSIQPSIYLSPHPPYSSSSLSPYPSSLSSSLTSTAGLTAIPRIQATIKAVFPTANTLKGKFETSEVPCIGAALHGKYLAQLVSLEKFPQLCFVSSSQYRFPLMFLSFHVAFILSILKCKALLLTRTLLSFLIYFSLLSLYPSCKLLYFYPGFDRQGAHRLPRSRVHHTAHIPKHTRWCPCLRVPGRHCSPG